MPQEGASASEFLDDMMDWREKRRPRMAQDRAGLEEPTVAQRAWHELSISLSSSHLVPKLRGGRIKSTHSGQRFSG